MLEKLDSYLEDSEVFQGQEVEGSDEGGEDVVEESRVLELGGEVKSGAKKGKSKTVHRRGVRLRSKRSGKSGSSSAEKPLPLKKGRKESEEGSEAPTEKTEGIADTTKVALLASHSPSGRVEEDRGAGARETTGGEVADLIDLSPTVGNLGTASATENAAEGGEPGGDDSSKEKETQQTDIDSPKKGILRWQNFKHQFIGKDEVRKITVMGLRTFLGGKNRDGG